MTKKRAVIYCRVSHDPTGQARSVASQEAECRAWCEREGWTVAEVLTDNDLGASRWSGVARPEYQRLRQILRPGDVLVTWEASRAQRDLSAYVELRELCSDRDVLWAYSGRVYDLSRGDDRFGTGLDALIAEREADQTRERVLRGKQSAADAGRPAGRPNYGYRFRTDPKTGRSVGWEVDPDEAPVVREVYRRFLAGESLRTIAADLERRGIPTPASQRNAETEWTGRRVRFILRSASYAGLRLHRGAIHGKGNWDAIVDEADWHRAQGILDDPSRRVGPGPAPRHLLSSLAICGECGALLRYNKPRKGRVNGSYSCTGGKCVHRRSDLMDELVEEVLIGRLSQPDAAAVFAAGEDLQAQAADEVRDLRVRLEAFTDSAAEGKVSPAAFARIEARLLPQIADAESRAAVPARTAALELVTADDVRSAWEGLPIDSRRQVVRTLLEVRLRKSSTGTRVFNPEDVEIRWKS